MEHTGMNRDPHVLDGEDAASLATLLRNKVAVPLGTAMTNGYGTHALLTAGRPRQAHAGSMVAAPGAG